jgi:CubicO group peptidase (beta-lactamase class C family)
VRLLAALALACAPALAEEPRGTPDLARIVEARLAESETPACIAVGLVAETTQVKFGCTEGAGPVALDEHSIFEIGSITKGFTGLLLADMVGRHEVSLDDAASKYARRGAKLPTRGGKAITLRDLVTHTSGLPRLPPNMKPANPRNPYADFDEDRLYEALAATEIADDGGRYGKYEYSNFGFMWLTDLLARRAGKPYDELLRERILDPLGMQETAIALDAEQARRFVAGHAGGYAPMNAWEFPTNVAGVGGLRSSLADMLKLARALAGREDTPLRETIARALAPLRPSYFLTSTGYAWVTYQAPDVRIHRHNGGTGGFRSMLAVNPATRAGAVVLVDSDTSFDDLALHLVDPASPLTKKRLALATDVETLRQYAGRYELRPAFAIEVFLEGERLMAQATGQRAFPVFREAPDYFYYTVVPAKLRFARDADGIVDGVTLEQGGRSLTGKRAPSAR